MSDDTAYLQASIRDLQTSLAEVTHERDSWREQAIKITNEKVMLGIDRDRWRERAEAPATTVKVADEVITAVNDKSYVLEAERCRCGHDKIPQLINVTNFDHSRSIWIIAWNCNHLEPIND